MEVSSSSSTKQKNVVSNNNTGKTDQNIINDEDQRYYYTDADQLQALRTEAPWMKHPKYITSIAISPIAVMKIMRHCQSGVDKGIKKGGNPVEVMGMLLGRPDPISNNILIVTDAYPLPIEGFETRVVADDENVVNHMIALGDLIESTRTNERFMGWYHSHPFDLCHHSHCFLSQTDLSTQLQWQRAEDPHGNPFVAIVVDPLRSTHFNVPEIKAFRAYPPEYNPPTEGECPDGTIELVEQQRLELWGNCWNRYYELKVEYFCSQISRQLLDNVTQDYMWIRTLKNQSEVKLIDELSTITKELHKVPAVVNPSSSTTATVGGTSNPSSMKIHGRRVGFTTTTATGSVTASSGSGSTELKGIVKDVTNRTDEFHKTVEHFTEVTNEQDSETALLQAKKSIFS